MTEIVDLWEQEQKLIVLLDEIQYLTRLVEGWRKVLNIVDSDPQKIYTEPPVNARSIFTPNQQNAQRIRQNVYMGGSIGNRLQSTRTLISASGQPLSSGTPILKQQSDENRRAKGFKITKDELSESLKRLKIQATDLSISIFDCRKTLNISEKLCEKLSAKELNIKMGGDGSIINSVGETIISSERPLFESCIGYKGDFNTHAWITTCVLCPANYADSENRLNQWIAFSNERKIKMIEWTKKYEEEKR